MNELWVYYAVMWILPCDRFFIGELCGVAITQTTEILDVVKGDVNGDDEFNVADVVTLQKWILAVPDVELKNWKAADLCEDDRLDVFDLCLMKRELVKSMPVLS